MDIARNAAGNLITIEQIRGLAVVPELWCPGELPDGEECGATVWATALESQKRAAAFAAHHGDGCDHGSTRSQDRPGDAGHPRAQGTRPVRWRMRLGAPEPSTGPDGRRRPDEHQRGPLTRRAHSDTSLADLDSADERSFSTMLIELVAGTLPAGLELVLGTKHPVPAVDLIAAAQDATAAAWLDRELIIWGRVAGYTRTRWEGLMLRLENGADEVAILVDKSNLTRLGITDPAPLVGRHVIAYGRYTQPDGSRRPHIRVLHAAVAFNPRMRRRRG